MSLVVVLVGPSGGGKGSVFAGLKARGLQCWESVSWTTRAMRDGEVEGREYHFVTREQFEAEQQAGGFLESFVVFGNTHGNLYGTPREPVEAHLAAGDDVFLELDIKGALAVREIFPEALLIFVTPSDLGVLRGRIVGRGDAMTEEQLQARLDTAVAELAAADQLDAIVYNDDLDQAITEVATLIERHRAELEPNGARNV